MTTLAPLPGPATQTDPVTQAVRAATARAVEIRHDLHRHPEIMFKETRTARVVCDELKSLGIAHLPGLAGGTGVLAHLPATTNPGSAATVALRADMDALPILEETGLPYASANPGVMHACGHDGHTAILLGAARALASLPERKNNVTFVFQPAEEGGAGGEKMCSEGALDGSRLGRPVDLIYGLHGWPTETLGKVSTRIGPLLAATDEFTVTIRGRGAHAAYPHYSVDPVVVAAHIVTGLQSIASRRFGPFESVVVTVGAIHAGQAFNVIPESAELRGTIRTLTDEHRARAEREFRRIVLHTAQAHEATAEIDWHVGYPVTRNDAGATERFRRIARRALGEARVVETEHPTMGGEDFSYYGQHVPACFFLLGLRPEGGPPYPNVHTPRFNFNDDAVPLGVELMCRVATEPV